VLQELLQIQLDIAEDDYSGSTPDIDKDSNDDNDEIKEKKIAIRSQWRSQKYAKGGARQREKF
jgi:hypothetical protein